MTATHPADMDAYLAAVRRIPMLGAEEEAALARAFRAGDAEAGRRLVESHLRLVVKVAYSLRGYGVPLTELIAEGNVGLMQALHRFEPERNLRFATYAVWWVRAAMLELVMQQATPVKVALTAERKRIFFKLRSLTAKLRPGGGRLSEEEADEVARQLSVRKDQVKEMEGLLGANELSLDMPLGEDGGGTFGDLLVSGDPDPESLTAEREEREQRRRLLADAWNGLSDREKDIVADRCLRDQPIRLEDLAKRYGISRERVRQIEVAAVKKLRRLMGLGGLMPQSA